MFDDYACMSNIKPYTYQWHQRMGHLNLSSLEKNTENEDDINIPKNKEKITCLTYQESKLTKLPFKSQGRRSKESLQLVRSYVYGLMETNHSEVPNNL